MNFFSKIDKTWTLFLDRDGVINHEKKGEYILNWSEFKFYDGVQQAMQFLSSVFGNIVMVTNQRGIGKGLMTIDDLSDIHTNMTKQINIAKGRIDKIYYCSNTDSDCIDRKPNIGMAHQAKKDFPAIDFNKSIMIGNKLSDMQFGKNAGMHTIFVATTNPEVVLPHPLIDMRFNDLPAVANELKAALTKS